jgi:internalin A
MKAAILLLGCATILQAAADLHAWIAQAGGSVTRNAQGKIVAVDLRSSWVTDSDLQGLDNIPTLTHLDLSLTRITDHGLQQLKSAPAITDLSLRYAEQITDGGIMALSAWHKLRRLDLRGTKITDAALQHLARNTSLEALDIGYVQVTDVGLTQLTTLTSLKELTLGGNKLTDVGLQALRQLPGLTYLDLGGAQRTDSGLWSVTITDKGAQAIASLKDLRRLRLNGSSISVRSLENIRSLTKLEQLDLERCSQIDDQAIALFRELPALKILDVTGTPLSPSALEKLRAATPRCRILPVAPHNAGQPVSTASLMR